MELLPLYFRMQQRPCLVVGGGAVALKRLELLLSSGAEVILVAKQVLPAIQEMADSGRLVIELRAYCAEDMAGKYLAIAATSDRQLNRQICADGERLQVLVNVVDDAELSHFVFPAIIDRSPVIAAVSSGAKSPVLSRLLRGRLESIIPHRYGDLATLVGEYRQQAKDLIPDLNQRRAFWEDVLQGAIGERVLCGQDDDARALLDAKLNELSNSNPIGEVYLVGGGPGDPDLLTLKALRLMQQADLVLYDRLVSKEVLALTRRDAEKIYVGKAKSDHAVPQEGINQLLVDYAKQGRRVLRLKGGDPFIFGRGGEELEELAKDGIPFQVVPGITAAAGCASYSGIPLTHRDYAQSVRFVTGHLKDGTCNLPWSDLVQESQTLVFYMGLTGLEVICRELIGHGRSEQTPIALVQKGTTADHRVWTSTLAEMPELVRSEKVKAPTLIIVGEVVQLHSSLNWFHN